MVEREYSSDSAISQTGLENQLITKPFSLPADLRAHIQTAQCGQECGAQKWEKSGQDRY